MFGVVLFIIFVFKKLLRGGKIMSQAQEVASHLLDRSSFSRRPTAASTRRYKDLNCSLCDRPVERCAGRVGFEHLLAGLKAAFVFLDMSSGWLGSEGVTSTEGESTDTLVWEGEEGQEEHGVLEPQEHSVTEKIPLSPLSYLCLVSTSAPG